jgi:hypothetical protein
VADGVNYYLFSHFGTVFGNVQFRMFEIHIGIGEDFRDIVALYHEAQNTSH